MKLKAIALDIATEVKTQGKLQNLSVCRSFVFIAVMWYLTLSQMSWLTRSTKSSSQQARARLNPQNYSIIPQHLPLLEQLTLTIFFSHATGNKLNDINVKLKKTLGAHCLPSTPCLFHLNHHCRWSRRSVSHYSECHPAHHCRRPRRVSPPFFPALFHASRQNPSFFLNILIVCLQLRIPKLQRRRCHKRHKMTKIIVTGIKLRSVFYRLPCSANASAAEYN